MCHLRHSFIVSLILFCSALMPRAYGQWQTQSIQLKSGYNGVYLFVDASHNDSLNALLGATPIDEVWFWKADLSAAQFITAPQLPVDGGSRWLVWKKGKPGETTLNKLLGNSAYIIKTAEDYEWRLQGKPSTPVYHWSSKGQNFIGFSTQVNAPNFDSFLSKEPGLVQDLDIFGYSGGALGTENPKQIKALRSAPVTRGHAYWIKSKSGRFNRYFNPIEVDIQNSEGVHYGERLAQYRIVVRNLTAADITFKMEQFDSEPAPAGQTTIVGRPPLLVRGTHNAETQDYNFAKLTDPVEWTLKPEGQEGSVKEIVIGLDRRALGGAVGAFYAGILRFTDSLGFSRYDFGVSASKGSLAGLWVGDVRVTDVRHDLKRAETEVNGANKLDANGKVVIKQTDTSFGKAFRPYPLRLIIHVAGDGKMTLLQRIYHGYTDGFKSLLATKASLISKQHLALSKRLSVVHLPWTESNVNWTFSGGTFSPGQTVQTTVSLGHNDHPSNPFLHTYHPDHDNRTATFNKIQSRGIESYDVDRVLSLSLSNPDGGFREVTRAHSRIGGAYAESVTFKGVGNEAKSFDVKGSFTLNRISTIAELTTQ